MLSVVLFFFAMITLLVCVCVCVRVWRWRCMYRGTFVDEESIVGAIEPY